MFRIIRVTLLFVAAAFAAPANTQSANAQTYPDRPVRILVPYAPGGITDIAARVLGAKLGEAWGHQVVVENRSGGNGLIAMSAAVKAEPDGYTLVMASGGDVSLNPALLEKMPYDVERDLIPISGVSDAPIVLAANSRSPYRSVAEVITAAKANRQHHASRVGVAGFKQRHQVPERPVQGRRSCGSSIDFRRCPSRNPGKFFGRAVCARWIVARARYRAGDALVS
jgi:tripartite-type tricarboxylate transporter receptor subunit TctC